MRFLLFVVCVGCVKVPDGDKGLLESDTDCSSSDSDQDGDSYGGGCGGGGGGGEGDCNDNDANVYPGQVETCNGNDDNCDGVIDEGVTSPYFLDLDGDGFGDPNEGREACEAPSGYVQNGDDCDDARADVYPQAEEACDGVDNDCDGAVDEDGASTWYADADGDGFGDPTTAHLDCGTPEGVAANGDDCDDTFAGAFPGNPEVCDEQDNNCDGVVDEGVASTWYVDLDGDGFGASSPTQESCVEPTGYAATDGDCDDADLTVFPGASEVCNGVDDDCDGAVDEEAADASNWYLDGDGDGYGDPASVAAACDPPSGYVANADDCDDGDAAINPDTVWYLDFDGDGHGGSRFTTTSCVQPAGYVASADDCDDADATVSPSGAETCNALDDDCDTLVDEGVLGTGALCPAEDCAEIIVDDPTAGDGTYTLNAGTYTCDMTMDGGGWTQVRDAAPVYGTGWDTSYYNTEGFTWDEALFAYDSGLVSAHCTYPDSLTGCNNLGFQFASESWGIAENVGSSICGMATTDYTAATDYVGGYDFVTRGRRRRTPSGSARWKGCRVARRVTIMGRRTWTCWCGGRSHPLLPPPIHGVVEEERVVVDVVPQPTMQEPGPIFRGGGADGLLGEVEDGFGGVGAGRVDGLTDAAQGGAVVGEGIVAGDEHGAGGRGEAEGAGVQEGRASQVGIAAPLRADAAVERDADELVTTERAVQLPRGCL